LFEYLKLKSDALLTRTAPKLPRPIGKRDQSTVPPIDRTSKLFIGGKQVRPDSGYSIKVVNRNGMPIAEVGAGNRKDIRNAVEAAQAAEAWTNMTGHARAQVLYCASYFAANTNV
jgi:aldehyde dehydrogenase (NAD+)